MNGVTKTWKPEQLGQPLAERRLSKRGKVVVVKLWAPRVLSGDEWGCPFQILGYGTSEIQLSHGVDAFQALQLGMESIGRLLRARTSGISWLGGEIGDAGFPKSIAYSLGPDFYYYLCDLTEREAMPDPNDLARSHRLRKSRIKRWHSRQAREKST